MDQFISLSQIHKIIISNQLPKPDKFYSNGFKQEAPETTHCIPNRPSPQRTALSRLFPSVLGGPAELTHPVPPRTACCPQPNWKREVRVRITLRQGAPTTFRWTRTQEHCDDPTGKPTRELSWQLKVFTKGSEMWLKFKLLPKVCLWPLTFCHLYVCLCVYTWTYIYSVLHESTSQWVSHIPAWKLRPHQSTPLNHSLGKLRWPN